jgi:hypothetical protein
MRKAEKDKIENLEHKISTELKTLNERSATMREELQVRAMRAVHRPGKRRIWREKARC